MKKTKLNNFMEVIKNQKYYNINGIIIFNGIHIVLLPIRNNLDFICDDCNFEDIF